MPDKRTHRGPHPQDVRLFAPNAISDLRSAIVDFSLLLTKGYAERSALKLVGDKFSLTKRQRLAIMRSACSEKQLVSRSQRCIEPKNLAGRPIAIDGYNVLITVEAAMSGACIFKGRDSCFRDLASIHGTYRKVTETIPAVQLIGEFLEENNIAEKVSFSKKEVWSNQGNKNEMNDRARECGLDISNIGVPFLYTRGECLIGTPNVTEFFKKEAGL